MKYVVGIVAGYFLLLWIADNEANKAVEACGGSLDPRMLHAMDTPSSCPGYQAAKQQWQWLPRVGFGL